MGSRLNIGDMVRLVSLDGESNPDLHIGSTGIVIAFDGFARDTVGVDWDNVPEHGYCHNLGGRIDTDTGYWVYERQVELIPDNFEAADDASFDDLLEV